MSEPWSESMARLSIHERSREQRKVLLWGDGHRWRPVSCWLVDPRCRARPGHRQARLWLRWNWQEVKFKTIWQLRRSIFYENLISKLYICFHTLFRVQSYGKDDTIGCFIDLDSMQIKWSKNGKDFGTAYGLPNSMKNYAFFASVCMKNAEILFNFGETSFKYPPVVML